MIFGSVCPILGISKVDNKYIIGVVNLAHSPDGNTIATWQESPEEVHLWDSATEAHKTTLIHIDSGFGRYLKSLTYSPDGKTIATQSYKEVFLWDAVTGECKITLTHGHFGNLISFAYSPDGKTIATGGDDGTVLLWDLAPHIHMEMNINPQGIYGNWRSGWALDVHTLSSRPLPGGGYDTERTELGEWVFQLKYRQDKTNIQPITGVAASFIREKFAVDGYLILPYLKAILPIPPSDQNRHFQPVTEVAQEIGKLLSVPVRTDCLTKVKGTVPLKNLPDVKSKSEQLRRAFVVQSQDLKDQCVLVEVVAIVIPFK